MNKQPEFSKLKNGTIAKMQLFKINVMVKLTMVLNNLNCQGFPPTMINAEPSKTSNWPDFLIGQFWKWHLAFRWRSFREIATEVARSWNKKIKFSVLKEKEGWLDRHPQIKRRYSFNCQCLNKIFIQLNLPLPSTTEAPVEQVLAKIWTKREEESENTSHFWCQESITFALNF